MTPGSALPSPLRRILPSVLLGLALAWTALIHYGLGPRPELGLHWWSPRGFLTRALVGSSWDALISDRSAGFAAFWTPVVALAVAVWLTTRSALLRAVAISTALAAAMFLFYALGSGITQVAWNLFQWRASGTMLAVAALVGATLVSPWLAARWLELGWPARLAWFLPVAFLVLAIERNVTGTNPRLPFAISPWPVVQVFALETVGSTVAAGLAGIGLGLYGLSRWRAGRGVGRAALAIAACVALPIGWLWLGSRGLLPFRAGRALFLAAGALTLAGVVTAGLVGWRRGADTLRRRALAAGTGAVLLGLPLLLGEVWARIDYSRTRDVYAGRVIDALQRYYARESLYPDSLEALVQSGDLDAVPRPAIGFGFLDDSSFSYQAFGTSFLLEFAAPRWVQCAYNPPYSDEPGTDDDDTSAEPAPNVAAPGPDAASDVRGGAWSCPSSPPELW